ncbi:hypothetical protein THAOC_35019 [Thalassiosira oceanica]|uniref:Uncharacterized protein n=1 Tax=Thalassiosira oceanica TaxID=159749 RepID=K0RB70_THAOC|nr:hypothetical protein THAOC_35019 [Thalassiosira oceanica]|eukprot:EJK46316.1 hypothetical protein THAOC_35019 [Thalassiosira oceanica]
MEYRSGSAHVFVRSGGEWTHQIKLLAPDRTVNDPFGENDWFGRNVAIYEDTIVVGAQGDDGIGCDIEPGLDDDIGCDFGSAHVFVRSGSEWTHKAKLLAPDGATYDYFGSSTAIYEDTIVVGADGRGLAHVFVRSGESWTHQAKLLAPDRAMFDFFGWSVAIYGDTIVVGAPWDGDFGDESGSAHVFVRSGMRWSRQVKLLVPDGAAGDWFGEDVAIYGNTIVIGR